MATLLLMNIYGWIGNMRRAIAAPYQLDYGEGIVWQQAKMIMAGQAYGNIDNVPHIIFHYPPLFHIVASLTASSLGMDGLAAGRLVSALSCLGTSLAVGNLVWQGTRVCGNSAARLFAAICTGLLLFSFMPIAYWSALYRVDNLAVFLTMLGLCFGMKAAEHRIYLVASGAVFVLALFTKQTMIAAPLACFLVTCLSSRKTALVGMAIAATFGIMLLLGLTYLTGGGFLRHIIGYNVKRIDVSNLSMVWRILINHAAFVILPGAWLLVIATQKLTNLRWPRARVAAGAALPPIASLSITYLLITSLTLPAILKSGANFNYLIDWMCALTISLGYLLYRASITVLELLGRFHSMQDETNRSLPSYGAAAMFFAISVQIGIAAPQSALFEGRDGNWAKEYEKLQKIVASTSDPIISDDMVMLVRAGKQVFLEPSIIAELTALGTYDETKLVALVEQGYFAFFMTAGKDMDPLFHARYSPALRQTILKRYPIEEELAGYTIHTPQP